LLSGAARLQRLAASTGWMGFSVAQLQGVDHLGGPFCLQSMASMERN
jgi:hypothetical protein